MNRRSLLAFLGLAPAAIALSKVEVRRTHPVVLVPQLQCGKCAGAMRWVDGRDYKAVAKVFQAREPYPCICDRCGITALVSPFYIQGEVIAVQEV